MASPRRRPPPAPPHRRHSAVPARSPTLASPPKHATPPLEPQKNVSPPKVVSPSKVVSPPKFSSPPKLSTPPRVISPPKDAGALTKQNSVELRVRRSESAEKSTDTIEDVPPPPATVAETDGAQENDLPPPEPDDGAEKASEESNGVGDKIKIFEKAAEDAATAGRLSRPGSVRRPRTERLPSDELPPPPPPSAVISPPTPRIVRPEFRLASPAEITIRSPSLGAKAPERFPSRGTAFRNVVATPPVDDEEFDRHKRKERHSTRGSGYYTRGTEEIWLVKKKDIEEIEERVLDSFRRARGNSAPSTRGRRAYARSESLEPARPEWRAQLKRQASVACTCGHDKKTRAKSVDAVKPRARSHSGDESAAVLDKYETLV